MAKQKHKVARYQVSLNEPQNKILKEMMLEDSQTEISGFFGMILVNEHKNRQLAKAKRPQGRPRKGEEPEEEEDPFDYSDDVPKTIPYYGLMLGPREYADKLALQEQMKPRG